MGYNPLKFAAWGGAIVATISVVGGMYGESFSGNSLLQHPAGAFTAGAFWGAVAAVIANRFRRKKAHR